MTAPTPESSEPRSMRRRDPAHLQAAAAILIIVAASWFLLVQLAPLLRPLLIAIFLAYILLPYHSRLRKHVGTPLSLGILAGTTAGAMVGLALAVYVSVNGLEDELPRLERRLANLSRTANDWLAANVPQMATDKGEQKRVEERMGDQLTTVVRPALQAVAGIVVEACVVGLYLFFLLLEASRLPDRVRRAYLPERAEEILQLAGQVNSAIVSYLRAKVKTSLALALPAGIVLWTFGVKFALLWVVLTFLCNFIPYLGSVIGYTLPTAFAFLWLDATWAPVAVAVLLLSIHLTCASLVEPLILGKAVGLSPLVILGSLAFWGLLWGIPGMFLAVPLTVVVVLVMKQLNVTRPVAKLLMEE